MEKFAGTPLGKWLEMRKEPFRDQVNIYVNSDKWRTLMWSTLFQGSRFYTTIGRFFDPKQGTLTARMFNLLTGMRYDHVRPHEEIRRMAEAAIFDDDKGLRTTLQRKFRDAYSLLTLENLNEQQADQIMRTSQQAIQIPEFPSELDEMDTLLMEQAE
jgi:hypothetical protein